MQGIANHHITARSFFARPAFPRARARQATSVLAVAAAVGGLIAALPAQAQAQTPASPDASSPSPWPVRARSAR